MVEKPTGVKITAILFAITALVTGAIGFYLSGLVDIWLVGGIIAIIGQLFIIGAALNLIFAWGIWTLQKWTWSLAYFTIWIFIIFSIPTILSGVGIINFILFWVLKNYLKGIKEYF